jgi:hypothetical protein
MGSLLWMLLYLLCNHVYGELPLSSNSRALKAMIDRSCGYLKKYPEGAIRFRTEIPDYIHLDDATYDWTYSVYGDSKEEVPSDMPPPRGNSVRTSTFEDANLMQDLTTGQSVTGILHLVNSMPADWFCKLQGSVKTATYGSEFVAAQLATKQIMDLLYTIRSLGAPIDGKSYMFGDNVSVITISTIPHLLIEQTP